MGSILISMPKSEDAVRIAGLIQQYGVYSQTVVCMNGNDVLRRSSNQDISLVICARRLKDMGYEELSTYLPASVNMIVVTKDSEMLPFSSNIVPLVVPFRAENLTAILRNLMPEAFTKPKRRERSEEERMLVDKAKRRLMEKKSMSEPEAFRYIQKISMDMGRTMKESAQMVLMMNST